MRLTDIMSNMDLAIWPKMGLIIFLIAFAAIVIRVATTKRTHSRHMASMPLEDDSTINSEEPRHGA